MVVNTRCAHLQPHAKFSQITSLHTLLRVMALKYNAQEN